MVRDLEKTPPEDGEDDKESKSFSTKLKFFGNTFKKKFVIILTFRASFHCEGSSRECAPSCQYLTKNNSVLRILSQLHKAQRSQ